MPNTQATSTAVQAEVQTLPQELCKETIAEWNDAAGDYVRTKMFDRKQFVTDADLEMGGQIQKLVAWELHITGDERQRQFWEERGGRTTVRNTVRKKRQTAQNSMKIAFRGELATCCVRGRFRLASINITNNFYVLTINIAMEKVSWYIVVCLKCSKLSPSALLTASFLFS
jgi:hypothetical protein